MQYKFRNLEESDIKHIMQLDKRFKTRWSKEHYLKKIKQNPNLTYVGFTDKGKMIGFILAEPKQGNIVISRVVVDKKYEGKGIGSKLMKKVIHDNPGKTFISHVMSDNTKSIMLHIKHNFRIVQKHTYKKTKSVGYTLKRYPVNINIGGYY